MAYKKILYLTLKKKWFDLIAEEKKKEEYRENKPYWQKRLINKLGYNNYDEIHFRNGYTRKSPFMRVKAGSIFRAFRDTENKVVFVIKLEKILEIKNYNGTD